MTFKVIGNKFFDKQQFPLAFNTRYHGVELGQVSCGKQTFGCGI